MSENATPSDLVQRWLHGYCERQDGVKSAVVLLGTGETSREAARWPAAAVVSPSLVAAARGAARRERALVLAPPVSVGSGADPGRILSLPLAGGQGPALGALAVALQGGPAETDEVLLRQLESDAATLVCALQDPGAARAPAAGVRLLQLQASLLGPQSLEPAARALCSELASTLGFDRVSLGLRQGGALKLIAASHGSEPGRQGFGQALLAAMQESIDQSVSIIYPLPLEARPRIVRAHAALAAQGPGTLLSVPLINAGEIIGALCFERTRVVTADELRAIESLACLLAPLIALKQRAEHGCSARASENLRLFWGGPSRRNRRLAWCGAAAALVVLAVVPVSHRIGAPARLEGETQRVLAAPSDGYLHATHVRPGDAVKAGQLLVELARQDLLLQNRKWEAELNQHQNSAAAALARADRSQYALAQARASEAGAQLDLAHAQLARTQVTAQIDGLVIKGDLTQAIGAPVQRGDILLTLAPRDAFRLIIEVDERDIGSVVLGQRGQLALSALPGERLEFTVSRIRPPALTLDGRNAFEVEAAFGQSPAGLRPGLRGVAKIDSGNRSLGWVATHRIGQWLSMATWTWGL